MTVMAQITETGHGMSVKVARSTDRLGPRPRARRCTATVADPLRDDRQAGSYRLAPASGSQRSSSCR